MFSHLITRGRFFLVTSTWLHSIRTDWFPWRHVSGSQTIVWHKKNDIFFENQTKQYDHGKFTMTIDVLQFTELISKGFLRIWRSKVPFGKLEECVIVAGSCMRHSWGLGLNLSRNRNLPLPCLVMYIWGSSLQYKETKILKHLDVDVISKGHVLLCCSCGWMISRSK